MPVLLEACPKPALKPSTLCAALCLSIAAAYDRRWISAPLASLLPDISAERLSRLKASVLPAFEAQVSRATRRGRPRGSIPDRISEQAAAEALLEVAASTISTLGIRARDLQDRLVQAAQRLQREQGVSNKRFAAKLGISARTLRYWRKRARPPSPSGLEEGRSTTNASGANAAAGEASQKQEGDDATAAAHARTGRNQGRFALEVSPPGLQVMTDTTDIQAFGVTLKLIGAQDTGNRHRRLLESFRVSEAESAQLVIKVIAGAFAEPAGTQVIVDQGTPYMAEATKKAMEKLGVDHCPQKEGAATDKAPLERAWRTIKDALRPLLSLTDRVAERVPALRDTALARAATELLVGAFLRVYTAARAPLPHPLEEAHDPIALIAVVEKAKERARAENRSRKLLLQDIHARYAMPGSQARFVRAHRRAALEDVQEAERRLRHRACRCLTRACDRYFAGILANVSEEGRARRSAERRRSEEARKEAAENRRFRAHELALEADPEKRLAEGLSMIAFQWKDGALLFGGKGLGRAALRRAIAAFHDRGPMFWKDELRAAWTRWLHASGAIPPLAIKAINQVLEDALREQELRCSPPLPGRPARAILGRKARARTGPPPWPPHLRI